MMSKLIILVSLVSAIAFGQSRPLVTFDTLSSLASRKPQSNEVVNILGQTNVGDWGEARLYRWDSTNALATNQNRIKGSLTTGRWLFDGSGAGSATNVLYYGAGDGIVFSGSSPTNINANLTAGTNIVFTTNSGVILIHSTASGSGTGTVSSVDVSGGATGLSFSGGPITTTGTITMAGTLADANIASTIARDSEVAAGYQPLDTDLTAFAGLAGNGLMVRTGSGTATTRSVAGTSGRVTVSDGDGVAANPTIDLVASGVSAATYNNVQNVVVDTYGRITAITNRTVLPLGSGTVLTNNQHYWASMSADRTLTFSGGTTDGDVISLFVTNTAALTLSFPASWDGAGGTAISSIYLLPANHELSWVTKNSTRIFIGSSPAFDVATTVSGLSVTFTNLTGTNRWTISGTPVGLVADGDKGDITVSSSGTVWDIDSGVVGPTELASTAVTPASYTFSSITVDADGRITAASSGTPLADGDKGDITVSASGATWNIDAGAVDANELASTAVVAGLYTNATVVIDADGRVTAATNGVAGGSSYTASDGVTLTGSNFTLNQKWFGTNTMHKTVAWWEYDFQSGGSSSPPFTFTGGNSGTSFEDTAYLDHPWVWTSTTGSLTNGYHGAIQPSASILIPTTNWMEFEWTANTPAISTDIDAYVLHIGLNDNSAGDATDGVYARYTHLENSGNWVLVTRLASTETVGNSAIAYSSTWNNLRFVLSGTNSAVMYVNGVAAATNTANIPGGSARTRLSAKIMKLGGSTGTTARTLILDHVKVGIGVVR